MLLRLKKNNMHDIGGKDKGGKRLNIAYTFFFKHVTPSNMLCLNLGGKNIIRSGKNLAPAERLQELPLLSSMIFFPDSCWTASFRHK